MKYDSNVLSKKALELGVVRNTLEKVIRLSEVLRFINTQPILKDCLALKGGTAINLLYSNLPRLSVDIDLDYTMNHGKEAMLRQREIIKETLIQYFLSEGYVLSKHARFSYALDAFVITYTPSGGGFDNIKIEINYVLRGHLLPYERKQLNQNMIIEPFEVLSVSKIELFAGKINALLSRNQIRDLYDTYQMIYHKFLNEQEMELLKNVLLFYRYIQNDSILILPQLENRFTKKSYMRDLLSVIKKGDPFELSQAFEIVNRFLNDITTYDDNQRRFLHSVEQDSPLFELLFDDTIKDKAQNHPLVIWKYKKYHIDNN